MNQSLGRTLRLYLVDGSPSGLIVAEILNWTGKVLSFPRTLLPTVLKTREEFSTTGVYFLVGPDPENLGRSEVYIGESDDVTKRLTNHDKDESRDFFEQITLVVSKDENLTKAHVRYLETRLIQIARQTGGAILKNATAGSPVQLPESDKADMEFFLQQIRVILPVLGLTFLQELPSMDHFNNKSASFERNDIFISPEFELSFLNGQIKAEGYEAEGQFVVRAGAICRHPDNATKSLQKNGYAYIMNDLRASLEDGTLIASSDIPKGFLKLIKNKAFKSPSRAASYICANPMSGPGNWKIKETGQTYKDWRNSQLDALTTIP